MRKSFTPLSGYGLLKKLGLAIFAMFVAVLTYAENATVNSSIVANKGSDGFVSSPWFLVTGISVFVCLLIVSLKESSRREA
jgi:hypothetical protein